jgi:hypothetical protein
LVHSGSETAVVLQEILVSETNSKRRMILCGGLQSGGTTLISWCFLQRRDTDGVLDMENDIIQTTFDKAMQPICWVKMTVGAFRWLDLAELYRDLGWQPAPLLIVRDARSAYSSLIKHSYGFNGVTAEEPPLRMRFRRFLRDWELFQANGWPVIKFEDFLQDERTVLAEACRVLNLPWDEGMISWPKKPKEIAYTSDTNKTFMESIAKGGLLAAKLPDRAALSSDGLPPSELAWLEEVFARYNDVHHYPPHLRPTPETELASMSAPLWEGSRREHYYDLEKKLLSEIVLLRAEIDRVRTAARRRD